MAEKKSLCRFTVQFNPADPHHLQVAQILNQQGRRKAQFLVSAVMHYLHCSETPSIPQAAPIDTSLIEDMVRSILAEQLAKQPVPAATADRVIHRNTTAPAAFTPQLSPEGIAAIASSLASFRR